MIGSAKSDFAKWYGKRIPIVTSTPKGGSERCVPITTDVFYQLPLSMQFSVVQDWADSVGYEVVIIPYSYLMTISFDTDETYSASIHRHYSWQWDGADYNSRKEAQLAAIKKLVEIYNHRKDYVIADGVITSIGKMNL